MINTNACLVEEGFWGLGEIIYNDKDQIMGDNDNHETYNIFRLDTHAFLSVLYLFYVCMYYYVGILFVL